MSSFNIYENTFCTSFVLQNCIEFVLQNQILKDECEIVSQSNAYYFGLISSGRILTLFSRLIFFLLFRACIDSEILRILMKVICK